MFDKTKFFRSDLAIDVIHDNRHVLPDSDTARESIPYTFHIPEEGIAGLTYTWVNKGGEAGAAMALYGPGIGDTPIEQLLPDRRVGSDMDFSNWQIDGFQMHQDIQFKHADVIWKSDAVLLEFSFDAIHPPYAYSSHAEGCPSYMAFDRIEQAGRCKGRIILNEREINFDTFAHRDHSWGTRDWRVFQHHNWFQGQSADGTVVIHYTRLLAMGREIVRGYIYKDGLMAEVTSVQSNIVFDDALYQRSMESVVIDEAGRTTRIIMDFYAHYTLKPSPLLHLREGSASASFDGKPGLGWVEVGWDPEYIDHITTNGPY